MKKNIIGAAMMVAAAFFCMENTSGMLITLPQAGYVRDERVVEALKERLNNTVAVVRNYGPDRLDDFPKKRNDINAMLKTIIGCHTEDFVGAINAMTIDDLANLIVEVRKTYQFRYRFPLWKVMESISREKTNEFLRTSDNFEAIGAIIYNITQYKDNFVEIVRNIEVERLKTIFQHCSNAGGYMLARVLKRHINVVEFAKSTNINLLQYCNDDEYIAFYPEFINQLESYAEFIKRQSFTQDQIIRFLRTADLFTFQAMIKLLGGFNAFHPSEHFHQILTSNIHALEYVTWRAADLVIDRNEYMTQLFSRSKDSIVFDNLLRVMKRQNSTERYIQLAKEQRNAMAIVAVLRTVIEET